jgi:hypothetical protein
VFRVLKSAVVLSAFARQSASKRVSSYANLPIGTIDQCISKVQAYKKQFNIAPFAVLVRVVTAPSKDSWTRPACADPYNRSCTAWLVSVCMVLFRLRMALLAHAKGRR